MAGIFKRQKKATRCGKIFTRFFRDRIVHHAIYKILYPYFDGKFIFDSYSCRNNKGTHRAMNRFRDLVRKRSCNNTRTIWILKGDIKKFFASIDHQVLKNILSKHIIDKDILWLLGEVIDSFHTEGNKFIGLPLGNVTSQLLWIKNTGDSKNFSIKIDINLRFVHQNRSSFIASHCFLGALI